MLNLLWRPIHQDHLDAIIELAQKCHAVDGGLGFMFAPDEIQSRFLPNQPGAGICAYALDGSLAACASVSIHDDPGRQRLRIVGHVRPDLRGKGIGTHLMQWSQEQAGVLLSDVAESPKVLQVATESLTDPAHRLYLAQGFACVFEELVMAFDLHLPLPDRPLPPDVTLTHWQPELADEFYQAYHASFRDRPGFPNYSAAQWIAYVIENEHQPDWSLLARINNQPVGFVTASIDLTTDPPGGDIWQVGTIPAQRRRGLASALLVETMRRMQVAGAGSAVLTVNTNNPGAIQAYLQLGYKTVGRRARYEKMLGT
jgi:mycothiol synthase